MEGHTLKTAQHAVSRGLCRVASVWKYCMSNLFCFWVLYLNWEVMWSFTDWVETRTLARINHLSIYDWCKLQYVFVLYYCEWCQSQKPFKTLRGFHLKATRRGFSGVVELLNQAYWNGTVWFNRPSLCRSFQVSLYEGTWRSPSVSIRKATLWVTILWVIPCKAAANIFKWN